MEDVDFKKLEIDKENDDVQYNDRTHTYWSKSSLQKCISVTTLIHKFTTFDEEFWSKYKALEAIMEPEDFTMVKPDLLEHKKFNDKILEDFDIELDDFENKVAEILGEWEVKRETACLRGSNIHKEYELQTLVGDYSGIESFGISRYDGFKVNTNNKLLEGQYVLPELLLSRISEDGILRLAGQADLVIVDGTDVIILDFKTNKEIKTKSFYDKRKRKSERMKYPLNNFDDTNFWHYTIQLSTYAWMIEKNNPNLKVKALYLLHHDHNDKKTIYECEYRKNDVERMLAFYKKDLEYQMFKERNTKCH